MTSLPLSDLDRIPVPFGTSPGTVLAERPAHDVPDELVVTRRPSDLAARIRAPEVIREALPR
ncbi:hypothetical protein [Kitasatospora sp. NPDC058218]|uniref:hypothetical protein n=1 Tax=Kitasatospora sp. NPDC058218 TaxID=3346385 RepID=UPI0036D766DC